MNPYIQEFEEPHLYDLLPPDDPQYEQYEHGGHLVDLLDEEDYDDNDPFFGNILDEWMEEHAGNVGAQAAAVVVRDETRFYCNWPNCEKSYPYRKTLTRHINETHRGIQRNKNHICPICQKTFYDAARLRAHLVSHQDVSEFQCEKCRETFKHISAKRRHVIQQHPPEGIRVRYPCPHCHGTFTSIYALDIHMKRFH